MYIRTREEALTALSTILALPDRKSQIIEVTIRIGLCLDPDPRNFLVDCQAALIEGGLEALRERRKKLLQAYAQKMMGATPAPPSPEPEEELTEIDLEPIPEIELEPIPDPDLPPPLVMLPRDPDDDEEEEEEEEAALEGLKPPVVLLPRQEKPDEPESGPSEVAAFQQTQLEDAPEPPPEEKAEPATPRPPSAPRQLTPNMLMDPLLDEVGTALDLLKVVDIAEEVFRRMTGEFSRWEIARQILKNEALFREAIVEGMRAKDDPEALEKIESPLCETIEKDRPYWVDWADSLRATCKTAVSTVRKYQKVHPDADDPELLFNIIAMSEERARDLLDNVTRSPADAVAYVSEIRTRVDWILSALAEGS